MLKDFSQDPTDKELQKSILVLLELLNSFNISPECWEAQNIAYLIKTEHYQNLKEKSTIGNPEAEEWIRDFEELMNMLNIKA
jgi:hypothetical protein